MRAGVSSIRPVGQIGPVEALYLARMIIGLSQCRPFSSVASDEALGAKDGRRSQKARETIGKRQAKGSERGGNCRGAGRTQLLCMLRFQQHHFC